MELAEIGARVIDWDDDPKTALKTPILQRAFHYYRNLTINPEDSLPCWSGVNPPDMLSFLPNLIVLGVDRPETDFHYRLVGTYFYEFWQTDLTGRRMSELAPQRPGSVIFESLRWVAENRRVISSTIPYIGPRGDRFDSSDVIMPFCGPGCDDVTRLLVAVEYVPVKRED